MTSFFLMEITEDMHTIAVMIPMGPVMMTPAMMSAPAQTYSPDNNKLLVDLLISLELFLKDLISDQFSVKKRLSCFLFRFFKLLSERAFFK